MVQKLSDKIVIKNCPNFVPRDVLECGQVFRYKKTQEGYVVFSRDKMAKILCLGDEIHVETNDVDYFYHYFDLETNYQDAIDQLTKHGEVMKLACDYGKGIRILNQDVYEMTISFVISANNNIKRIQQIIEKLCIALGSKTDFGYAFPTLDQLCLGDEQLFKNIGAGYRAKYLVKLAQELRHFDLDSLKEMDSATARKKLLTLSGVGPKVADCILLFGANAKDVFPTDTWIKKVYHQHFESGLGDGQISSYFVEKFGSLSGLAQQYLFYFQRKYLQS